MKKQPDPHAVRAALRSAGPMKDKRTKRERTRHAEQMKSFEDDACPECGDIDGFHTQYCPTTEERWWE